MTPGIRLLRPRQWIKNAFVFAPLFFAHKFLQAQGWELAALAALAFLGVSCTVYVINDIRDAGEDRLHPVKRYRPLAAREITQGRAVLLACATACIALAALWQLPRECSNIALIYLLLNVLYTLYLKRIAIVDIFFVASCYVLRVLMGCYALEVTVSPWIILTTFLLALFLGFGKRYHEMGYDDYARHKPNLQHYSRDLLDRLITISGGSALMAYAIYTTEIARQIGRVEIVYTVAFVAFGLFRYLQSIHVYKQGGEPEGIILKDKWQLANAAAWLAVTLWILYPA